MSFTIQNHIIGKVYDLTQENMNDMIATVESLLRKNAALTHGLERVLEIESGINAHYRRIAVDALEVAKAMGEKK